MDKSSKRSKNPFVMEEAYLKNRILAQSSRMNLAPIIEVLNRAHRGSLLSGRSWENDIVGQIISEKLKSYGLTKAFDPSVAVNFDDSLANDYFAAGFEVAVEAGRLCVDSERVIKFNEKELRYIMHNAPQQITVGESIDERTIESRKPESQTKPKFCAPLGIAVSEELWIPLMRGVAQCRDVDILQGCRLNSYKGVPNRSGTPYEIIVGNANSRMQKQALELAGRRGMASTAVISAGTFLGHATGFSTPNGFSPSRDIALILSPSPLKTTYDSLEKTVYSICNGTKILSGSSQMFGNETQNVDSVPLIMIASAILELAIHQSSIASSGILDVRYNGSCGVEAIWATSVAFQAISNNTNLITNSVANQVAGPCTRQILYESAVSMMNFSASGLSMTVGPRSAGGKFTDYLSPLEVEFCGQVLKNSSGMKRSDVNEIAKRIIPLYEETLRQAPMGKSFPHCYDVDTMQPSAEWIAIYHDVVKELTDSGVPISSS